jgi:hypothetical protein
VSRHPRKRGSATRNRRSSPRNRSSSRKRGTPAKWRRRRRQLVLVAAVAVVAFGVGASAGLDGLRDLLPEDAEIGLADPGGATPGGSSADVDADEARTLLAELEVGEWADMRGYSRDRFSHWRTVDGCNARQTVLARDGEDVEVDDDCRVVAGTWYSPFDGFTTDDPGDIDIDHLVPLANAWRTGAADWDDDRRADFANDLDTPQLIAVSATSNRAKGDQDPSEWKPPERGYWCQYAHDWVVVKHHWQLRVTGEEKDALSDMLDTCD